MKVLFIAGFGPIVRETATSRKLYSEALGIPFTEESGEYLHTEALQGAKTFALWPLSQAAHSCFGNDSWPADIPVPQAWLEFDVDHVENATADLESRGYRVLGRHHFHSFDAERQIMHDANAQQISAPPAKECCLAQLLIIR